MKTLKILLYATTLLALSLPAFAQERTGGEGERAGSRSTAGDAGTTGSMGARSISVGDTSGASSVGARSDSGMGNFSSTPNPGNTPAAPRLEGTSFYSYDSHYQWQNFLWHLQSRYMLDGLYFRRFYRNNEPLVTPQLLKLALREPVGLSTQMVSAVDELELMLADHQAGKQVSKQEIAAKTQVIRDLAKKIRQDNSLTFIDQRLEKDLAKGKDVEKLGLEAISQLREMVLDLNTQLKEMYDQTKTASVSVGSLSQPSIESLSKGIERLTKVIDNSARRL